MEVRGRRFEVTLIIFSSGIGLAWRTCWSFGMLASSAKVRLGSRAGRLRMSKLFGVM
jgi:hypothetical protein